MTLRLRVSSFMNVRTRCLGFVPAQPSAIPLIGYEATCHHGPSCTGPGTRGRSMRGCVRRPVGTAPRRSSTGARAFFAGDEGSLAARWWVVLCCASSGGSDGTSPSRSCDVVLKWHRAWTSRLFSPRSLRLPFATGLAIFEPAGVASIPATWAGCPGL